VEKKETIRGGEHCAKKHSGYVQKLKKKKKKNNGEKKKKKKKL